MVPAPAVSRFIFPPDDCLPMSDEGYDDYRHSGMTKEIIETYSPYSRILYCKYGCCGDGTNNGIQCCLADEEDSGLGTLKMVSIVAAGVVGLLLLILSLVHYIKANNKKKRMVADIQSLQQSGKKAKKNKKAKRIKVGEYQRDQMNRGGGALQNQWNSAPQGNIFVTHQALPSIPAPPKAQPPDPSEFTAIVPKAGDEGSNYHHLSHRPVPPPAEYYNPDREVLKSIIANLPGPKVMSTNDNDSKFYGRY